MCVMSESYNRHCTIDWGLFRATERRGYDSTFIELENFTACTDAGGDRSELHRHLQLVGIVGQHINEVCHGDFALRLLSFAGLRFAGVGVIRGAHQREGDGVFESVCVEATMATPACMIAV